jgi:hypothetical protein
MREINALVQRKMLYLFWATKEVAKQPSIIGFEAFDYMD